MRTCASDIIAANSHAREPRQAATVGDRDCTDNDDEVELGSAFPYPTPSISLRSDVAASASFSRQSRMEHSICRLSLTGFSMDIGVVVTVVVVAGVALVAMLFT